MLIVSWNVAGLKPALQRIHGDYGTPGGGGGDGNGGASAKSKPGDAFANYLRLHGDVDVLCLQEHKIPLAQLSSRSEPHRCSTVDGYESFWSCATGQKSRGFNGVVTYVRSGLIRSADGAPLGDAELDKQGRCVMTDHGKFSIFNVYVPHSSSAETLPKKMNFLNALHRAMERQREGGKHVMLVGDLNLKIDKRDIYWKHRMVNVDEILDEMKGNDNGNDGGKDDLPTWEKDIASNWNAIVRVLQTIEALPRQTKNPTTGKTFDRYIARVKVADNNYVTLGNAEDTAEDALGCYNLEALYYNDPSNDTSTLYRKANCLCIDTLAELMSKICNVTWNEKMQRQIAESRKSGLNPDHPAYLWMKKVLEEDGMVDVFRQFYPTAEARFTCWHQMRNMRYSNVGGRIDFTLVDKALMTHVEPNNDQSLLRCGKDPRHNDPLGEEAAFLAATASGLFVPGTYAGGGIAEATKRALDTQFGAPHSGMIYTPPSYSDHVAVSLLMKGGFREHVGQLELLGSDAATRKAQPHKKQRSVASFFSAAGSQSSSSSGVSTSRSSSSSGEKRTISREDGSKSSKKKSLDSYFGGSKTAAKENGSSRTANPIKSASNKKKNVPKNSVLKHFGKK